MIAGLAKMAPVLRLTRVSTAFAAVADVWFVILWTRANEPEHAGAPGLVDAPLWVLLLAGARVYRLAVVLPGVAGGALLGLSLTAGAPTSWQLGAAGSLALVGGVVFFLVERLAIALAGAFVAGGAMHALGPLYWPGGEPWYADAAAVALGLLLFPRLYRALLPVITAALGALVVAWSVGQERDAALIGAMTAVGVVVQLAFRRRRRD